MLARRQCRPLGQGRHACGACAGALYSDSDTDEDTSPRTGGSRCDGSRVGDGGGDSLELRAIRMCTSAHACAQLPHDIRSVSSPLSRHYARGWLDVYLGDIKMLPVSSYRLGDREVYLDCRKAWHSVARVVGRCSSRDCRVMAFVRKVSRWLQGLVGSLPMYLR